MTKINILLFDVDGVIVNPLAYRVGITKTIELLCKKIGLKNFTKILPTEEEVSYMESKGIHDVWDITNIVFGKILTDIVIRYKDELVISSGEMEKALAEIKDLGVEIDNPNYIAIADKLDQGVIGTKHPPEVALDLFSDEIKNALSSGNAENAIKLLENFLVETRNVYSSYGTRLFQNIILGGETFEETYCLTSEYSGESLLKEDELMIKPKSVSTLMEITDNKNTFVGIYTGRPSKTPKYWKGDVKGRYSPEAEIVLEEAGMVNMPLIAMGMMEWLGMEWLGKQKKEKRTTEELTKPNITQAFAAVICATNGGNDFKALDEAYKIDKEGKNPDETALGALKGSEVVIYVFEDTTSGIKPMLSVRDYLNERGYSIKVSPIGIAKDQSKVETLSKVCEAVFPDVNESINYVVEQLGGR